MTIVRKYFENEWIVTTNQIFHFGYLLLPFSWAFGWLPNIDVLILYLLEEINVLIFGGTGAANNWRLFVMFAGNVIGSIIVSFEILLTIIFP